ncbi:hypothetical protein QFZ27_000553 [Inquilinus ginsengisoli]|uniref:hypothetical protein n=1 Tax=Inquilinus ginsengisoli TaxID=363840 RepID=UPI003D1B5732
MFSSIEAPADDPTGRVRSGRIEAALRSMERDVRYRKIADEADYVAFADTRGSAVWTFTTRAHRPHPAVVCREPKTEANGTISLVMRVSCYGSTPDCDGLVADFKRLNERTIRSIQEGAKP